VVPRLFFDENILNMSSDFVKSGTSLDGEVSYSIGVPLLLIGATSIVNVVLLFVLTNKSNLKWALHSQRFLLQVLIQTD